VTFTIHLFATGLLTETVTNLTLQRTIQENILQTGELKVCFSPAHYLMLQVTDTLHIETKGWNDIQEGIKTGEIINSPKPQISPQLPTFTLTQPAILAFPSAHLHVTPLP
jgi:hypothetical protein